MVRSVQYLRAIAALMVVCVHCALQYNRLTGQSLPLVSAFNAGVDIFFVISGFVMWQTTATKNTGPREFIIKRLIRICPLYWLITLLVTTVAICAPSLLSSTIFDFKHLLASIAFVPWKHPKFDAFWPVLIPGWTLNLEIMFYAIFALSLYLPGTPRLIFIISLLSGFAALGASIPQPGILNVYTNPIILEFGFGVLLGAAFASGIAVKPAFAFASLAAGTVLLFSLSETGLPRVAAAGISALLICLGAVYANERIPKSELALLLGDASYSIYLTQVVTLPVVTKLWSAAGLGVEGLSMLMFITLSLMATAAAGCLTYQYIERPLLALARSLADIRTGSSAGQIKTAKMGAETVGD